MYKCFFAVLFLCVSVSAIGQVEEENSKNSLFYYSGALDNTQKMEFNLQVNGFLVSGSCILTNSGELFVFNGRMARDKTGIGVLIYDSNNQYVASMEAQLISDQMNFAKEIKGVWKPSDRKKRKKISLKKVAELADSEDWKDNFAYSN